MSTGYTDTIHRVMNGSYANASFEEKTKAVRDVTLVCSVASAAIAIQPVPLLDMALLAPIHVAMVQAIGQIHGAKLDRKSVIEILGTFGASIVTRGVVLSALKLVPVFGWAASASMAYAMTYAIGEASHAYFASGRGMSSGEMRSMFDAIYARKRAEKEAAAQDNVALKEKLRQLTDAFEAGLLTEAEYRQKKEQLLAAF
jgi:uncharacterized protein (DUF697 family)